MGVMLAFLQIHPKQLLVNSRLCTMSTRVKRRKYDASRRRRAAEQTRAAVLGAARELFTTRGYARTSVLDIARLAGVSVDTLYATVGRKPQLLLAVHDMVLAGADVPLDAEQRDYVQRVRAAPSAEQKIAVYADALAELLPRTVPLLNSLRAAGESDPACRDIYAELIERRSRNMRLFAADLRATGQLRDDLDDDTVADIVWSMNAPEYYSLIRSRGWTPQQYARILREVWTRTLLRGDKAGSFEG
jgi:AcrR family transcriptional regulator